MQCVCACVCLRTQKADENGSDGLDIDEFKSAFGEILGQGKSDQQVCACVHVCTFRRALSPPALCAPDGYHVHEDRHQL